MTTESTREIDLLDHTWHTEDPWPTYTWLREEAPVYWDAQNELWGISRYDDIIRVSKDPETFSSEGGNVPNMPPDPSFINHDGVKHLRQKKLIQPHFTPARIAQLEQHIRGLARELLDEVADRKSLDFVHDIAAVLPMRIIGEMLDMPRERQSDVQAWVDDFVRGGGGPQYVTDDVTDAFAKFTAYHEERVELKRAIPGNDFLSIWLGADFDGDKYDYDTLLFEHTLILVGGSETTRHSISGGLEMLLANPGQKAAVMSEPGLWRNAVEEIMRWTTPFVRMSRTATRDGDIRGTTISEGQQVVMLYPPANRDPRHFDDPETFDIGRKFRSQMLSFGFGSHYCIGAYLARMEVQVMIEETLRRFPNLSLDHDAAAERSPSGFLRGLKRLPIILGKEA